MWAGIGLPVLAVAYLVLAFVVSRQVPTTASVEGIREPYSTSYQPEDRVVCTNPNHQD
jgi:hypothetical protein